MKLTLNHTELKLKRWLLSATRYSVHYCKQNKLSIVAILFVSVMAYRQLHDWKSGFTPKYATQKKETTFDMSSTLFDVLSDMGLSKAPKAVATKASMKVTDANVGNTYSNVSHWGERNDVGSLRAEKRERQQAYVNRFSKIAQAEMRQFGIPASISLAQGLVESNAGDSKLSVKNNNHFGMKCFSHSCTKGHCSNFTDDTHKDFFLKFDNPWKSFRAHSKLLKSGARYRRLFRLRANDYRNWALGLKAMGYATDPHYANSLIRTIEDLDLQQYDK